VIAGRRGKVAGWVVLAGAVAAIGACGRPDPSRTGAGTAAVDAPLDAPSPPFDTASGVSSDAASEGPPSAPPDGPAAPECTPGVRACIEGPAARTCSEQGRWLPGERCGAGSTCSGGACVCAAGACEDGVLRAVPGHLSPIAAGGDLLHYLAGGDEDAAIHSIDLRTRASAGVLRAPAGHGFTDALAADAMGAAYWCTRSIGEGPAVEGALLRGTERLAPDACADLRVTAAHVTYTLEEGGGLFRRALRPDGAGDRETITPEYLRAFAVTDTHVFISTHDGFRQRSLVEAIPVDDLTRARPLAERVGYATRTFDRMAADGSYVYVSYDDQILRVAVAGGDGTFQTVWSGQGREIEAIVLGATHVYWATVTRGVNGCSEAAFWRRSKLRDDEPLLLARRERACPTGLALSGDRVYAAVSGWPGPSQILRLRR
jgi:hypothetical protein